MADANGLQRAIRPTVFFNIKKILFCISVTGYDELNKLACSQYMGLHSSVGRALQR